MEASPSPTDGFLMASSSARDQNPAIGSKSTHPFGRAPSPQSESSRWFTEEVQPHESALRGWLRVKFPALTDIDDLVQEAFARVLAAHRLGKVRNAKSYLFATARNAALDLFRHNRNVTITSLVNEEQLSVIEDKPSAAETLCDAQDFEILRKAIDALPARCREIMTLQKLHGLSDREIAERLGISVNTVK